MAFHFFFLVSFQQSMRKDMLPLNFKLGPAAGTLGYPSLWVNVKGRSFMIGVCAGDCLTQKEWRLLSHSGGFKKGNMCNMKVPLRCLFIFPSFAIKVSGENGLGRFTITSTPEKKAFTAINLNDRVIRYSSCKKCDLLPVYLYVIYIISFLLYSYSLVMKYNTD